MSNTEKDVSVQMEELWKKYSELEAEMQAVEERRVSGTVLESTQEVGTKNQQSQTRTATTRSMHPT